MKLVQASEATASKRRVYFQVTAADGVSAVTTEAGSQPQVSTNGGAFTNTGIGTLTHIGDGRYYADLTAGAVATIGDQIETRYKGASTAESVGDSVLVVAYDPYGTAAAPGGVTNPGATGFMTLTTARGWVRQFARNAGSSTMYPNDMIDRAIQAVGEDFLRETKAVVQVDSVAVTLATASVDVSGLAVGFAPERLIAAYLSGQAGALDLIGFDALTELQVETPTTGAPSALAFEDSSTVSVWPTPDAAYTLRLRWWVPFTTWTPGVDTATADTIHLNIRPDHLLKILPDGAPAMLQHNEKEMGYATASWARYVAERQKLRGAGSLGAKFLDRRRAD